MSQMPPEPSGLIRTRRMIDAVDDAMVALLAGRGVLVRRAAVLKRAGGRPARDPGREARVHARAQRLAPSLGLPAETARALIDVAIADACRQQQIPDDPEQSRPSPPKDLILTMQDSPYTDPTSPARRFALRCIPPPTRMAPLVKLIPTRLSGRLLERTMARVLAGPLAADDLDFMAGRRLGIQISDLGLEWVIVARDGQLTVCDEPAEATVRGTVTDLLLLASRLEDADTLFFQRRLVLTGDTELGLTVRNLLERLPWESVPLGLRIGLNRSARLARAARDIHHGNA